MAYGEPVPDQVGTPRSTVVALHGFTQTGACLGPALDGLLDRHVVIRPDLPGHGDAARLGNLDLWGVADHLVAAITPTLDGPAVWFGYSLGGRVALHVALAHPESVAGLVLVGATAGIVDDSERSDRHDRDVDLADHILAVGVDAFLDEWLAGPLFTALPDAMAFRDERRRNTADGLASSLRRAGTGAMEPLWDRLGSITTPVLCLTGSRDERFTRFAEHMVAALPDAHLEVVDDAGHAAHLEQPDAVAAVVTPFCDRLAPRSAARIGAPAPRWYQDDDETSSTR